jgi:hypothetical protein
MWTEHASRLEEGTVYQFIFWKLHARGQFGKLRGKSKDGIKTDRKEI